MFIAIVGTRYSGKTSIESYLVAYQSFTVVRIVNPESITTSESEFEPVYSGPYSSKKHLSFLSMSPLESPPPTLFKSKDILHFSSSAALLKYVTRNWRTNFVTVDLTTRALIEPFIRRPFFLLVKVDAPLLTRFRRFTAISSHPASLEEFVQEDDLVVFGANSALQRNSLVEMNDLVNINVTNSYDNILDLHTNLENLDILDPEHLRPGWDAYFMTLASLASHRSNCMKRRVGAIVVRENRVLATGYNGTPRGLKNCNEGGCPQCNETPSKIPYECVCLHAEENALLEAGRERVGENAVLYCNTCPCLRCTVKIIQSGIKTVVYNLTYKVDDASASLFKQANVCVRKFDPGKKIRLTEDDVEAVTP